MPSPQLPQKQVGIVSGIVDLWKKGRAAKFAGVIDDYVAETEDPLRYRGRDSDVLNLRERYVARGARSQVVVNLDFCIRQSVADHVPLQMIVGGNEQQR